MSKIIIGVVVIVLIAGGVWLISREPGEAPGPEEAVEEQQIDLESTEEDQEDVLPYEMDGDVKVFTLEAGNFYFSIQDISVNEGDTVRIVLESVQGEHDWVLDEFDVHTEHVHAGEVATAEFVADQKGEFEYYCGVGRHRELGQVGTLIVE